LQYQAWKTGDQGADFWEDKIDFQAWRLSLNDDIVQ